MDLYTVDINHNCKDDFIRLYQELSAYNSIIYHAEEVYNDILILKDKHKGCLIYDDNHPVSICGIINDINIRRYPTHIIWGDFLYIKPKYRNSRVIYNIFSYLDKMIEVLEPNMVVIDCPNYLVNMYNKHFKTQESLVRLIRSYK